MSKQFVIFYSMDGDAFNRLQFSILDEFFNQKNSRCAVLVVSSFMFVSILSFPLAGNPSLILKDSGHPSDVRQYLRRMTDGMTDLKPRNSAGGISLMDV